MGKSIQSEINYQTNDNIILNKKDYNHNSRDDNNNGNVNGNNDYYDNNSNSASNGNINGNNDYYVSSINSFNAFMNETFLDLQNILAMMTMIITLILIIMN